MGEADAHLTDCQVNLTGRLVGRAYELGPLSLGAGLWPLELVDHQLAATAAKSHPAVARAAAGNAASSSRRAQQAAFVKVIGVGITGDLTHNNANPCTTVLAGPNSLNLA